MLFLEIPNTPQSSERHSSKLRCENCAKCGKETLNSRENFAYVDMHEEMKTTIKFSEHSFYLTEWFRQQTKFAMMNKCFSNLYVSVRRKDGSYYKRNSLLSVRAALDRHLISPPYHKKHFISINQSITFI